MVLQKSLWQRAKQAADDERWDEALQLLEQANNEDNLQLHRFTAATSNRVQPHRDLVASLVRRGIESGEFRADLDIDSTADLISQLHGHYSGRAYRRDPLFPLTPKLVDAAVGFIHDAVRAPAR